MKTLILILLIVPLNLLYGQEDFLKGTQLLQNGDYKGADSILTIALCTYRDENVYYNRGIARLYQKDTIGYCMDMSIAAYKYMDQEATVNYNTICCKKVDTLYYDNRFRISSNSNYRYYEEIKYPRFDSINYGIVHDIQANNLVVSFNIGCTNTLLGINKKYTDIIASYELVDTTKYYITSTENPSFYNTDELDVLKEKASKYFSAKYLELKKNNQLENLSVYYELSISPTGEILNMEFLGIFPDVDVSGVRDEMINDLSSIISRYPKITPGHFRTEKIYFKFIEAIDF